MASSVHLSGLWTKPIRAIRGACLISSLECPDVHAVRARMEVVAAFAVALGGTLNARHVGSPAVSVCLVLFEQPRRATKAIASIANGLHFKRAGIVAVVVVVGTSPAIDANKRGSPRQIASRYRLFDERMSAPRADARSTLVPRNSPARLTESLVDMLRREIDETAAFAQARHGSRCLLNANRWPLLRRLGFQFSVRQHFKLKLAQLGRVLFPVVSALRLNAERCGELRP